jgi:hypothetical protein
VWWDLKSLGQGEPILETLRAEPALAEFHPAGNMRVIGSGGAQAGVEELATWLLGRAADHGIDQALHELARYVTSTGFEITFVTGVLAAAVDEPIQLAPMVGLIPLTREDLSWNFQEAYYRGTPLDRMRAALATKAFHPKVYMGVGDGQMPAEVLNMRQHAFGTLEAIRLLLGLVKPSPSVALINTALLPDDLPIRQSFSATTFMQPLSLIHFDDYKFTSEDGARCQHIVELYNRIPEVLRTRLLISINRLHSGMARYGTVDGAIDLGIALESLFLPDASSELTYRLKIRGGRLLGSEPQERLRIGRELEKIYHVRSTAVHSGTLPKKPGIDGFATVTDLILHGYMLLARSVVAIMEEQISDWDAYLLA